MDLNFSPRIKDVISYSKEEAERLGNRFISPEHLLLGILREGEGVAMELLRRFDADIYRIKDALDEHLREEEAIQSTHLPLLQSTERVLKLVHLEAKSLKSQRINTGHLLIALLKEKSSIIWEIMAEENIHYQKVREALQQEAPMAKSDYSDDDDQDSPFSGSGSGSGSGEGSKSSTKTGSDTPVLDNFGIDITKAAEENRLDPIVGREKEIERLAQILSRRRRITRYSLASQVLVNQPLQRDWPCVSMRKKYRACFSTNAWSHWIWHQSLPEPNTVGSLKSG